MKTKRLFHSLAILVLFVNTKSIQAQRLMENLNRGIVAIHQGEGKVFVSWRLLGTDPEETGFNLYRSTDGNPAIKLTKNPITATTTYVDKAVDLTKPNAYFVKRVVKGQEGEASESVTLPANFPVQPYLSVPLQTPAGSTPNDASVGDLDGDGAYEIILHQTGKGRDNASAGITDPAIFQSYKLDGTLLWTINLGKNIREGAHYTQFMVIDLDGDGKAEFSCKTADGTMDGKGKVIGDSTKDWRNKEGKILDGPEFFTVFNGETGAEMGTTDYIPARGDVGAWGGIGGNGGNDSNGNRVDRFTACVAYLDGKLPSVVMGRGYYGRTVLAAWDWRGGKLTSRWVFDSQNRGNPFSGMGNHNLSVADVDEDGKDEIIFGSMVVDDNGKGLFSTGLRHGDALHVSDLDPFRPGLEVFGVHENETHTTGPAAALYSARTGEIYWQGDEGKDAGRGVAADIDPNSPGAEMWWSGSGGLRNMKGEKIGEAPSSTNFLIWWDGDLTRELLDGNRIDKYKGNRLLTAENCSSNNGTKATPTLSADILGDWREEVIFKTDDKKELRIFTTTIPTDYRFYTLMHDPQYRLSIAWQNVGYNQPPHPSFHIGVGMKKPPRPHITVPKTKLKQ